MFKMHQIHLRPGLRPRCRLGSSTHSMVGWDLGQGGGQDECLPRAPQTFTPLLQLSHSERHVIRLGQHVNTVAVINSSA